MLDLCSHLQKEPHSEVEMRKSVGLQNEDGVNTLWFAGESQAPEEFDPNTMESLLCHEVLDNFAAVNESSMRSNGIDLVQGRNDMFDRSCNMRCPFSELDNITIDTPPDFQLSVRFIPSVTFLFRAGLVLDQGTIIHFLL